jgi:hypothetical protein
MMDTPGGQGFLNLTINYTECYAKGYWDAGPLTTSESLKTPIATSISRSGTILTGPKVTGTPATSGKLRRTESVEKWMMIGTGLAAAVMSGVW